MNLLKYFVSFYKKHKLVSTFTSYEDRILTITKEFADGSQKVKKYEGSCTVWYECDENGIPFRRCSSHKEYQLMQIWNRMKFIHK